MKTVLKIRNSGVRNAYDVLAPFYEHHWGTAFFERAKALFENLLTKRVPVGSRVLDLCCGSGDFAAWLSTKGLQVSGVDSSHSMLERAILKAPRSTFFKADMTGFRIPISFDVTTCFYNSINQVLTLSSLRKTLASVHRHLRPGGWFLFDVIQEHGYEYYWDSDQVVFHGDGLCEVQYRYDRHHRRAVCHITIHEAQSGQVRGRWVLVQRPFSVPLLSSELDRLGFRIEDISPVRNGNPLHGRIAILARRKPAAKRRRGHRLAIRTVDSRELQYLQEEACRSNDTRDIAIK